MPPVEVQDGQAWVAQPHKLQVGDRACQIEVVCDVQELHRRFELEWFDRWDAGVCFTILITKQS